MGAFAVDLGNEDVDKARSILSIAWSKIDTPKRHCIGSLAMDVDGSPCDASSVRAVRWCALGALLATLMPDLGIPYVPSRAKLLASTTLRESAYALYGMCLSQVNDKLGYGAVRLVYQHARGTL